MEVSPGSFQDLKGATVDVLDEMDPEGMLTVGPTDPSPPSGNNPPPPGGNPPSPPPTNPPNSPAPKDPPQGNVPTAECPCTYEQLNQHGCCNGVAAICNWISNEPKLLGPSPSRLVLPVADPNQPSWPCPTRASHARNGGPGLTTEPGSVVSTPPTNVLPSYPVYLYSCICTISARGTATFTRLHHRPSKLACFIDTLHELPLYSFPSQLCLA